VILAFGFDNLLLAPVFFVASFVLVTVLRRW
jgi:hypothetical protein